MKELDCFDENQNHPANELHARPDGVVLEWLRGPGQLIRHFLGHDIAAEVIDLMCHTSLLSYLHFVSNHCHPAELWAFHIHY
jgi:hypothetical protein